MSRTHGHTWAGGNTPTYGSWTGMIRRCYRKTTKDFARYGALGVTVCQRWRDSFEAFLADMGKRPKGKTLDRINPNGDYTPSNCRWATPLEQAENRRQPIKGLTLHGVTKAVSAWARQLGVTPSFIHQRLRSGWSVEKTLTAAKRSYCRNGHPYEAGKRKCYVCQRATKRGYYQRHRDAVLGYQRATYLKRTRGDV